MVSNKRILSLTQTLHPRYFCTRQSEQSVRKATFVNQFVPNLTYLNGTQSLPIKILSRSENIVRFSEEEAMKKTEEKLLEKESKVKLFNYIKWLFKESRRKLKKELKQMEEQIDDDQEMRLFKKVRYFLVRKIKFFS